MSTAGHAARSAEQHRRRRHHKEVPQFTCCCSGEVEEEEMLLADDAFHVAPEQVEDDGIAEKMPDAVVQNWRGEKLPRVGVLDAGFAQAEVGGDERRIIRVEEELRDKGDGVEADQPDEDDALALCPRSCKRRGLSAGQAHANESIAPDFRCRFSFPADASRRGDGRRGFGFRDSGSWQLPLQVSRHYAAGARTRRP
jgi:hypothetical protein